MLIFFASGETTHIKYKEWHEKTSHEPAKETKKRDSNFIDFALFSKKNIFTSFFFSFEVSYKSFIIF